LTLLISFYTSSGLVWAADSQTVTWTSKGGFARHSKQTKVLAASNIGVNGALVGFFGLAQVDGQEMSKWLRTEINGWPGSATLRPFAEHLRDRLKSATTPRERKNPSGFHLGAFERRANGVVPVMWYVRNMDHPGETLAYGRIIGYHTDEHFPPPDWPQNTHIRQTLRLREEQLGFPMWFRNGDLPFAFPVQATLELLIQELVKPPGFGVSHDLDGWDRLSRMILRLTGDLYRGLLQRGDPPIEGPYPTKRLPWPA
jgi:hypothetical protein